MKKSCVVLGLAIGLVGGVLRAEEVVLLGRDDTELNRSCVLRIPSGLIVADANQDGVVHLTADNIVVRLEEGSVLHGASGDRAPDALEGIGVCVDGRTNVTLIGWRVHGFKVGLLARRASGLMVDGGDFSGNYRQRLRSTPEAEDSADWLFPHHNDTVRWRDQYGAAICVEESAGATIRGVRVRRGQNGILLDRVQDSRVYDNDCSFLSGWGLALWRSSGNTVSRNAFDFCIRGHAEGVYNRGQDSAGILCFEQSSGNLFLENSATHGGDGFFGFAGREAIGEVWLEGERERLRREIGREDVDDLIEVSPAQVREMSGRGCNRNRLIGNDFSYAAAHGIELTFSKDNVFAQNRLVENAICGVWGGYSSGTKILGNWIEGNGGMAYGLERGGINMEHASHNEIRDNTFLNNKCALHLWWDDDAGTLQLPGVRGNVPGVTGNRIVGNRFLITPRHPFGSLDVRQPLLVLQLRDESGTNLQETVYARNEVDLAIPEAREFDLPTGYRLTDNPSGSVQPIERPMALGTHHPVGARAHLRGRDQIVMDTWGPWDHESPLVRPRRPGRGEARFELWGFAAEPVVKVLSGAVRAELTRPEEDGAAVRRLALRADPGVASYRVELRSEGFQRVLSGAIVSAAWSVTVFPWTVDPREDLAGWRAEARGSAAIEATVPALQFPYGWGGPRDQGMSEAITRHGPAPDHFGMIARTRLRLPAGPWRFRTLSDDGVRVVVNGTTVLENWSWHGPARDEVVFTQEQDAAVEIRVEHFEIDGYATLELEILPAAD